MTIVSSTAMFSESVVPQLLGIYFAEFDNVVGPKIVYQVCFLYYSLAAKTLVTVVSVRDPS